MVGKPDHYSEEKSPYDEKYPHAVECPHCGENAWCEIVTEEVEYGQPTNTNTRGNVAPNYKRKPIDFCIGKCPECGDFKREKEVVTFREIS